MTSPIGGRWRRVTATFLLVLAPTVTTASTGGHAAAATSALLIGDSVMNGMAQSYGAPARAALAARYSYILDTAGCRRLITTSCHIGDGPTPTNAITALRARAGQYDQALVMGAGYNDSPTGSVGMGAAIDTIVAEATRQGISHVIWLTYREAGSSSNIARFRANNAVVRAKAGEHPQLVVADWAARSASLPANWFSSDGIHLGSSAASAMADLIGDALDQVLGGPGGGPGGGTVGAPNRCLTGSPIGDVPSDAPPLASAAPAGGMHLLASPVRLVDTRTAPGKVGAGRQLAIPIAGSNGVPADASAAILTVTSVEPCSAGFVSAYPCASGPAPTSVLNAAAGATVANSAIVRLGGGAACVFTSQPTDVLVDLTGFIAAGGAGAEPLAPRRLVDTRPGEAEQLLVPQQRLEARQGLTVDVSSVAGATAAALSINLTAVAPAAAGFVTALPGACTGATPSTSNVNVAGGRDAAAAATVGVVAGQICIFSSVATDIVVDLQAVHPADGSASPLIEPITPARLADTRTSQRLAGGTVLPVSVDTLLASEGPTQEGTVAAIVNVTAVDPAGSGFAALYPCDAPARPIVSNVNLSAGTTVANLAVVSAGATRAMCVFTSVDADIVIDVEAWVRPGG